MKNRLIMIICLINTLTIEITDAAQFQQDLQKKQDPRKTYSVPARKQEQEFSHVQPPDPADNFEREYKEAKNLATKAADEKDPVKIEQAELKMLELRKKYPRLMHEKLGQSIAPAAPSIDFEREYREARDLAIKAEDRKNSAALEQAQRKMLELRKEYPDQMRKKEFPEVQSDIPVNDFEREYKEAKNLENSAHEKQDSALFQQAQQKMLGLRVKYPKQMHKKELAQVQPSVPTDDLKRQYKEAQDLESRANTEKNPALLQQARQKKQELRRKYPDQIHIFQ